MTPLTREQIAAMRAAQPALDEAMAQLHSEASAEAATWPNKGRDETWAAISLAEYDAIAAVVAAHDALLDIAEAVANAQAVDVRECCGHVIIGNEWDDDDATNKLIGKRVAVLPLAGEGANGLGREGCPLTRQP